MVGGVRSLRWAQEDTELGVIALIVGQFTRMGCLQLAIVVEHILSAKWRHNTPNTCISGAAIMLQILKYTKQPVQYNAPAHRPIAVHTVPRKHASGRDRLNQEAAAAMCY